MQTITISGEAIRQARIRDGLSRTDLVFKMREAYGLAYVAATIGAWERNESRIPAIALEAIIRLLNIRREEIVHEED